MDSMRVHIRQSTTAVLLRQPGERCGRPSRLRAAFARLRASLASEGGAHPPETGA